MATHARDEESIFAAAIEKKSAEARTAYVEGACAGDAALRRRVEALLKSHEESPSFLESPPPGLAETEQHPVAEHPGTVIGPYKLREQIGEGGMGVVFVAEQERPVRRKVAMKIVKPGMDTKEVIARFEAASTRSNAPRSCSRSSEYPGETIWPSSAPPTSSTDFG